MKRDLRGVVVQRLRQPVAEYSDSFSRLLESGREIESRLEAATEFITTIRGQFSKLVIAVDTASEGISFFEREIEKTKEFFERGIAIVNESLSLSNQVGNDLNNISKLFDRIHADGVQLEDIIKNINTVSDSIEVASRNATITAFHAGIQGRGFEVIAREMTALVKNVQAPTQVIPDVSEDIIKGTVDLGNDLLNMNNLIYELTEINDTFSHITDELLALIPNIEEGIKAISESVESQRVRYEMLEKANEESSNWLNDIYDVARSSTILEISLETMFRRITNIKENLFNVHDDSSFRYLYDSFKIALTGIADWSDKTGEGTGRDLAAFGVEYPERLMVQLATETNQLHSVIKLISNEMKNWLKTNILAADVLSRGISFYHGIQGNLGQLGKKLSTIREKATQIEKPLNDLRKITERSKVLALYAGIESVRSGERAPSLGTVTEEIRSLSEKSTLFVDKIGEVSIDMSKNFQQLSLFIMKTMSDVEQGMSFLQNAIDLLEQNKKILEHCDNLLQEMNDVTDRMRTHCNSLSTQMRNFNRNYEDIFRAIEQYVSTIRTTSHTSRRILEIVDHYAADVSILEKKHKTITFRQSVEPIVLDPAFKTDARSHEIIEQIFAGLLTFDSSNHLMPSIAESFSVSKDGRIWDFLIKRGVKFHNGDIMTARHVADTIARVKSGPNVSFVDYVENVTALDEYRLRCSLQYPFLPFLANLACGILDITPKEFSPEHPIGAGPYRFVHWDENNELILEAFEDFFDGRPPIDRIVVKIISDDQEAVWQFNRGNISLMQVSPDIIQELDAADIVSGPGLSTEYIDINVSIDTPFKNRKVRQAMNHVVDKNYFANRLMNGHALPAYGVFPPGMFVYNKNLIGYRYDIDKARQLMREAGYGGGIEGTYPLDIRKSDVAIQRAEYIKECFEKIGIKVILNPLVWKDLLEKAYRGESLLNMKGWVSDNGDPDNFMYPLFHSKSCGRAGNTSFYCNQKVDEMIERARFEKSSKRRSNIYNEVERIIVEDAPWVFLSHGVDVYAVSKKLHGFRVDPFGIVRFRYLWCSS